MSKKAKKKNDIGNWCFTFADKVSMTIHAMTKASAVQHFKEIAPNAVYYCKRAK